MTVTCNQTNQESFSYENPRPVETKLCNIGPEALTKTTNHLPFHHIHVWLSLCPLQHLSDAGAEMLPDLI